MSKNKPKAGTLKRSMGKRSKELLKALQKMILNEGGSVTYIFNDTRVENVHSHKKGEIKDVEVKSMLHANIGKEAVDKKTVDELAHMFETTRHDLGADTFIVG